MSGPPPASDRPAGPRSTAPGRGRARPAGSGPPAGPASGPSAWRSPRGSGRAPAAGECARRPGAGWTGRSPGSRTGCGAGAPTGPGAVAGAGSAAWPGSGRTRGPRPPEGTRRGIRPATGIRRGSPAGTGSGPGTRLPTGAGAGPCGTGAGIGAGCGSGALTGGGAGTRAGSRADCGRRGGCPPLARRSEGAAGPPSAGRSCRRRRVSRRSDAVAPAHRERREVEVGGVEAVGGPHGDRQAGRSGRAREAHLTTRGRHHPGAERAGDVDAAVLAAGVRIVAVAVGADQLAPERPRPGGVSRGREQRGRRREDR